MPGRVPLPLTRTSGAVKNERSSEKDKQAEPYIGILPVLQFMVPWSAVLELRSPESRTPPPEQVVYTRKLPFFAQNAIDRGYALPQPFGLSLMGAAERECFGSFGRAVGSVPLTVSVNVEKFLPSPIGRPTNPCGLVEGNFAAEVDTKVLTMGIIATHGWRNYWQSGALSGTASVGSRSETVIRSYTAGVRLGRRWSTGRGRVFSPCIGASYLYFKQRGHGTTRLNNAFLDGDSLDVR